MECLSKIRLITLVIAIGLAGAAADAETTEERAYAFNRDGMVAMSEARFEEAIDAFQRAAALVTDYGIRAKPLVYTPVFMTGWASEKIGGVPKACASFRRFLDIAPPEAVEATKAAHAREYVKKRC